MRILVGLSPSASSPPPPRSRRRPPARARRRTRSSPAPTFNSFMKKCETDAKATCTRSAPDKKLAGAAKTSFTKKCVTDAIGA